MVRLTPTCLPNLYLQRAIRNFDLPFTTAFMAVDDVAGIFLDGENWIATSSFLSGLIAACRFLCYPFLNIDSKFGIRENSGK